MCPSLLQLPGSTVLELEMQYLLLPASNWSFTNRKLPFLCRDQTLFFWVWLGPEPPLMKGPSPLMKRDFNPPEAPERGWAKQSEVTYKRDFSSLIQRPHPWFDFHSIISSSSANRECFVQLMNQSLKLHFLLFFWLPPNPLLLSG